MDIKTSKVNGYCTSKTQIPDPLVTPFYHQQVQNKTKMVTWGKTTKIATLNLRKTEYNTGLKNITTAFFKIVCMNLDIRVVLNTKMALVFLYCFSFTCSALPSYRKIVK